MGTFRKKRADWDLFQPFPSASRADSAPSEGSLDLFAPPPGYQPPGRQDRAPRRKKPSKPPESELNLFEPPPGASAPKRAPEPQRAPEPDLDLFAPPPAAPPERARAPEEAQPARAPTPPPRSAPSAPGRQVSLGEQTGQMRRTQEFRQFVREKYNGGDVQIRHPDPEKRQRRPTIKFWTAMKYDTFKAKVKREFEAWRQEQEAQRPRAQIGERITDLDQVRVGDFVQSGGVYGTKYKVMRRTPRQLHLQVVSRHGRPTGAIKKFNLARAQQKRLRRIDEVRRPDVQFEQAQAHIDSRAGHPPRDVQNKTDYRAWLKRKLTEGPRAPFAGLRDDETRHQEQLERHIDKILEERGIDEDWEWKPPARAQIGERVQAPLQLKAGDFIQYYGTSYKVINVDDDGVRAVPVDQYGRPTAAGREFSRGYLHNYPITRIEAVQRPDVPYDRFKEFAKKELFHPPKEVNTRAKYKEWIENKAKLNDASPYKGLGSDEVEHKNALEKQIKKLLEERGVGPDWTWEPPARVEIGKRIRHPMEVQVGDFVKDHYGGAYKVTHITDDYMDMLHIRADGAPQINRTVRVTPKRLKNEKYTRVEPIARQLDFNRVEELVEQLGAAPRDVRNQDDYRKWLKNHLLRNIRSPYYLLKEGEEPENHEKLKEHINKILEKRGIDEDWTWTPPPPITFPVTPEWKARQKELEKIAEQGQKVGPDRELGRDTANAPVKRLMRLDGDDHHFIFKAKHKEPGQDGSGYQEQISNKTGIPSGEMHNREQAAYEIDRLLGEDTVVPVTRSSGEGEDGLGAYQAWIDGMDTVGNSGHLLENISDDDFLRHQDVGRIIVLDVLLGHQDRHANNLGFSWVDPNKPHTAKNLRFHAIDNGYALATSESHQDPYHWDIRNPWLATGSYGSRARENLIEDYFKEVPDEMRERLQKISTKDLAKTLIKSGLKDKHLIRAAALRLAILKNNPEALANIISEAGDPIRGQQAFQYESTHEWEDLLETAGLPDSIYDKIVRDVREALRAAD